MRHATHDLTAPRRTVSLTINSDLMARAKAAKINVSAVSEAAVAAALAAKERGALLVALAAENAMYEQMFEEHGSFTEAVFDWLDEQAD